MTPEKRNQVLAVIASLGRAGATVPQIAGALNYGLSATRCHVRELRKLDMLEQIGVGKDGAPVYVVKAGVEIDTGPDIFEQCRQNWGGYLIHKIFGAGGAVRLTDGV